MSESVGYLVKLKYIKKARIPVERDQRLAEFLPLFHAVGDGNSKKVVGKVEIRTRVYLPEFLNFLGKLNFKSPEEILIDWFNLPPSKRRELKAPLTRRTTFKTNDDYSYLRLLIYGVSMSYLKTPNQWERVAEHILSMEPIQLRFWASKFRNAYWKYKNRRILTYLAKRFVEVEMV